MGSAHDVVDVGIMREEMEDRGCRVYLDFGGGGGKCEERW